MLTDMYSSHYKSVFPCLSLLDIFAESYTIFSPIPSAIYQCTYLFLIERQMQPRDVDLSETNFKVRGKLMMYLPENEIDFFMKYPAIPMHF